MIYCVTNGETLVSHKTLLSDVKVAGFFFATEQKNWLHVVNSVFDDEFRTVETFLVGTLCHEWRDVCFAKDPTSLFVSSMALGLLAECPTIAPHLLQKCVIPVKWHFF